MVKKSLDVTLGLQDLRTRALKVVTFFGTSTTAKEKLTEVQEEINLPVLKLIHRRWTHAGTAPS